MKKVYKVFLGIIITIILEIAVLLVRVIYLNSINKFDPDYEILLENMKFFSTPVNIKEISLNRFNIPTVEINMDDNTYRLIVDNKRQQYEEIELYRKYYYERVQYLQHKEYNNYFHPLFNNMQTINCQIKLPNYKGIYHCLIITNFDKSVFIAWHNKIFSDNWDYRSDYYSISNTTRIIYSNLNKAEIQKVFPEFDGIVKNYYPKRITINYEKMPKSSKDNIEEHIQFEW